MMRIAIAGAGGFAYLLASQISQGANALLILSTQPHDEFEEDFPGCQVTVVDYAHSSSIRYALQGVDLVISTIGGPEQLKLISGAERARVRYFVPSEFEGCLSQRPTTDPLDRGSAEAIRKLEHIQAQASSSHPMRYTVFSCGIFMERFQPGGLCQLRMGASSGVQMPGDYLVDIADESAEIVENNEQGNPVQVCMTSVYDVVKFVAAAIEMDPRHWPREYKMRGDVMTVRDIVGLCSNFREAAFSITTRTVPQLHRLANQCAETDDIEHYFYYQRLIATANGRYYFQQANLNSAVNHHDAVEVRPVNFREWLQQFWGS